MRRRLHCQQALFGEGLDIPATKTTRCHCRFCSSGVSTATLQDIAQGSSHA